MILKANPLDELGATIFFQLVSARYERGSIILSSNKSYGDWGSIFGDPIIATAILDRLLHHSTTINIRGESYRLKDRRRAGLLPQPGQEAALSAPPAVTSASAPSKTRRPEIFNSDQGAQFTCEAFTGRLEAENILISMDGRGRALDNVFVERLWRTVKYEDVYLKDYSDPPDAVRNLGAYFKFYNRAS